MASKALEADRLYRWCDPESLPFETTEELEELDGGWANRELRRLCASG